MFGGDCLCRLCLRSGDRGIDIFNPKGKDGFLLWIVLKELAEIQASQGDGLPHTICEKCTRKLSDFKNFKMMCIISRIEFLKLQINSGLVAHSNILDDDIFHLCRLCLKSGDWKINVLDPKGTDGFLLWVVMKELVEIPVYRGDGLPHTICDQCMKNLSDFKNFKMMSINSGIEFLKIQIKSGLVMHLIAMMLSTSEQLLDTLWIHMTEIEGIDSNGSDAHEPVPTSHKGQVPSGNDEAAFPGPSGKCVPVHGSNQASIKSEENDEDVQGEDPFSIEGDESIKSEMGDVSILGMEVESPGNEQDGAGSGVIEKGQGAVCKQDAVSTQSPRHPVVPEGSNTVSNLAGVSVGTDASRRRSEPARRESGRGRSRGRDDVSSCFGGRKVRDKLNCVECGASFFSKLTLSTHIRAHQNRNEDTSAGNGGGQGQENEYGTNISRPNHEEVFGMCSDLGREGFICDHCGKACSRKAQLISHICSVHLKVCVVESTAPRKTFSNQKFNKKSKEKREKTFICDRCGKVFVSKQSLMVHIDSVHLGLKPFHCNICFQRFSRKNYPKKHVIAVHIGERHFKCEECGKAFKTGEHLRVHMLTHLEKRPFPCTLCPRSFLTTYHLRSHMKSHSGRNHTCEVCGKNFKEKLLLQIHIRRHSQQRFFKCEQCFKAFKTNGELLQHSLVHSRLRKYSCGQCGKKFILSGLLSRHMRTHDGKKPFECEMCHKKFSTSGNLRRHMRTHDGKRPFECELCHKKFSESGTLSTHMRTHDGKRPYECQLCHKKFSQRGTLSSHMRIHDGVRTFKCEVCNKMFSRSSYLSIHRRTHDGIWPYECQLCHKKFILSCHLRGHMRTHDGKKPFECEVCHRKFSRSHHLSGHMRVHDRKRPFECKVCHKNFSQRWTLSCHMRTHDGNRPFECQLCHKKYSRYSSLRRHMRAHDGKRQ